MTASIRLDSHIFAFFSANPFFEPENKVKHKVNINLIHVTNSFCCGQGVFCFNQLHFTSCSFYNNQLLLEKKAFTLQTEKTTKIQDEL